MGVDHGMNGSIRPRRQFLTQTICYVAIACFAVEFLVMLFLGELMRDHFRIAAAIDAVVITLTVIICMYLWVLPRISQSDQKMDAQAQFLETLLEAIPAPIFCKDAQGIYTKCNSSFEKYLGLSQDKIIGHPVYDVAPHELARIYHKADLDLMQKGGTQVYETSVLHADGTMHDVMFHKAVYSNADGELGGLIGVMLDITERKTLERKLETLASLDALTGLPNRREFETQFSLAIARAKRAGSPLALFFIDLDWFKDVNDRFGHSAGDCVLTEVGKRIAGVLRKSDMAARYGGDEFAVILEGDVTHENTVLVAEKLLATLAEPYQLADGSEATISASIGIVFAPSDGENLDALFTLADTAMYNAKNKGRNEYVVARK